jgi:hypothetical protein
VEELLDEFNMTRPHEALAWSRPIELHLGRADRDIPNFELARNLPDS